jgi:hypothetical protein
MNKHLSLLFTLITCSVFLQAQVVVFHEDFELPSVDDSVSYSSTPTSGFIWNINTRLHHGSSSYRSDSCQVKTGNTVYLTSNSFNTVGNTYVNLSFSQICKVDFLDIATIEVSSNGGGTWTQLTSLQYTGTGQYGANGNRFASNSYGNLWVPGTPGQIPSNLWWRTETFDISTLVGNVPDAKVRFKLSDGGPLGPNNNKGWFLDNIMVTMAPSELIPPVITLVNPYPQGVIYSLGPFTIKTKITDASGIDTAFIVYSLNSGPDDTVGMIHTVLDTMIGILPAVSDSDEVCWHVEAFDNSLAHNWARNPVNNCISFTSYGGITFPFYDNFDINTALWTPSYGGTNQSTTWQLGTPAYQSTSGTHSPPNAWDVNLSSAYDNSAYCILTSPVFDFSNAVNARMAFWIKFYTETNYDGTRMEYTTNGTTWQLLGNIGDPLSQNWYTNSIYSTNQPAWAGPPNAPSSWIKCKYRLSVLNNVVGQVRFRYIFNSDGSVIRDGFSIDDFSITLPAPQEVAIDNILSPTVGSCGMGNEYITIKLINSGLTPITQGLTAGFKKAAWAPPVIETIPDTLNPDDTITYTFTTPIDLSTLLMDSTFTFKVWVHLDADPNTGDDTLVQSLVSKFVPPAPGVTNVNINYGTTASLTATSASPIKWYDALTGGTLLMSGPSYTTPILYGTTVYYPEATATNGCIGPRASDTVFVGQAPPFDGSTLAIVAPVSGINLPNNAVVTSQIKNYGTQAIMNFPISYKINNLPTVTETCPDTVQPGEIFNYSYTTTADLSTFGTYHFALWLDVPGDANHVNDTVFADITNSMFTYCISRANYTSEGDIGNVTISNINNGVASPITNNPAATAQYTDFTQLTPIYLSRGQDYTFSLTGIYEGSHYTSYAKVFVDWDYNGIFDEPTETAVVLGPTTSSNTTLTGTISVPVTAHLGLTMFRVVFQVTSNAANISPCSTYSYGETEDYLTFISPQLTIDAGVTSILTPPATYPQGYSGTPTVRVKNFGLNDLSTFDVFYQVDNGPVQSLTWTGSLPSNTFANVVFPSATFANGNHEFCAWIDVVNDSNAFNDTLCKIILGVPVDTLPYYDNFDGPANFTATTTTTTSWILGAPGSGNFPTTVISSPNVWCTNLNISGGYTSSANCILTTQIFDFTNAINAKMSFWIIYNTEQNYDGTRLEYSLDAGSTWHTLGAVNDPLATNWYTNSIYSSNQDAWAGNSNGWIKATYLLSAFNQIGTVRFRFIFTSDGSINHEGCAIDDFKIIIPQHKDAGVDLIYAPTGIADAGSQLQVQVRLNNFGMDPMTTTDIKYKPGNGPEVTETWNGNLAAGDSTTYTFITPYTVPVGTYTLKSYTSLLDDGDHNNDTATVNLFGLPTYIVPYIDNFDSATGFWYTTGTLWEHGTPASSVIDHPYTPPYCWKTNLDGTYPHAGMQYLYSPKFDFSIAGMDTLKFMHWVHTSPSDWGKIEYFSNDSTWRSLGYLNDVNGYNWYNVPAGWTNDTNDYILSKYDLKMVIDFAIPTQFRWAFNPYTYNNTSWDGWAVDNVEFTFPKIQIDAGVIDILQPAGTTTYGTDITVKAVIKNFGSDTLTYIPVKYMLNGITVAGLFYTNPLLPDSTAIVTFNPIPSPLTSYTLCAYTDVNFDTYYFNDSSCRQITVVPPPFDIELIEITNPINQTHFGDSATVSVNIKNVGLNPVTDIPITYTIQDTLVVINEVWHGTDALESNQSLSYTFTSKYLFLAFGYYNLCVYTGYPDDGYRFNDSICQRLESYFTEIPEIGYNGFYVLQNTPNPADENTQIVCKLPTSGNLEFRMIDHLGQIVSSRNEKVNQGEFIIDLNTKKMAPGLYYYYINFGDQRLARKMIVSH